MTSLFEDYKKIVQDYTKEYGERTIAFVQNGHFFEMYDDGTNVVDIKGIAELLNILVTRKNKNIIEVSKSNLLMSGVPIQSKDRHFKLLTENNYTVVVIEQTSEPPNPTRAVTQVLSPGMPIISNQTENNFLCCIYLQEETKSVNIGFSIIDVSTGFSAVYQVYHTDDYFCYEEIYRLLASYNPNEIVIFGTNTKTSYEDLKSFFDIKQKYVHNKLNLFNEEIIKVNYQEQVLKKAFTNTGMLSRAEFLDLERKPFALTAFTYLLNFAFQHDENVLEKIQKPEIIDVADKLILSYNAISKLDIASNKNSLLQILNNCVTAIGKRLFKTKLLNPIIDSKSLNDSYNMIDIMIINDRFQNVSGCLKNIYDIEKLYRKICVNKLNPAEWCNLDSSFKAIGTLCNLLHEYKINNELTMDQINCMIDFYSNIFDMTQIAKFHLDNVTTSFFVKGYDKEIDDLQARKDIILNVFQTTVNEFNKDNEGFFKLDNTEKDGLFISSTSKRFQDLKKKKNDKDFKINGITFAYKDFETISTTTSAKITHPIFDKYNRDLEKIERNLEVLILSKYKEVNSKFAETFDGVVIKLIKLVGEVDVWHANAKNAVQFAYVRPELIDKHNGKSFINVKSLRHPIVERIIDTPYVINDISLGEDKDGILLYGLNSCGKSVLTKAIATNVIMAQAGMFVSCSSMIMHPYHEIFTRVPSGDDMFMGKSTFIVEISELRSALSRANKNSLCISDELASGTENLSATAIVASTIIELCEKQCSFITASHLHDIVNIESIKALQNLCICHLEVTYDSEKDTIIYNRKLKNGCGSTLYGLDVCKYLKMSRMFLERANDIRRELLNIENNIVDVKKSKYNTSVYVDQCEICKSKSSEIHHIVEQHTADKNGMIGMIHKNAKSNLMNVCNSCHDKIHNDEVVVEGFVQTGDGVLLQFNAAVQSPIELDLKRIVKELLQQNKQLTEISKILKVQYAVELSAYKLRKLVQASRT